MHNPSFLDIARMMVRRHGLRAQAIAMEHAAEMRLHGDAAGLDRWQRTHTAICELRRTAMLRQWASRQATSARAAAPGGAAG
jgi:hypothetical protein